MSLIGKEIIRVAARLQPFMEEERGRRSDPQHFAFVDQLAAAARQAYPDYDPWYAPVEERRTMGLRL